MKLTTSSLLVIFVSGIVSACILGDLKYRVNHRPKPGDVWIMQKDNPFKPADFSFTILAVSNGYALYRDNFEGHTNSITCSEFSEHGWRKVQR